jgi:hypothetical protein
LLLAQTPALTEFLHLALRHFDDWLLAIIAGAMTATALTLLGRAKQRID